MHGSGRVGQGEAHSGGNRSTARSAGAASQPSQGMPKAFQGSLLMPLQPDFTKGHLQQEEGQADAKAQRVTAIRRQVKPERKIDQGPGYGLRDIICQAHFPVKTQIGYFPAETFLGIQ